jgi:hypothetical protein
MSNTVRRIEEMRRRWGVEPLDFVLPRGQSEHMTTVALAHDEELHDLVVAMIAYRLVENTNSYQRRHFFVFNDRAPVLFATQWRYKNISGVTFRRKEFAAAVAWVERALLAGFTVFYSPRKVGGFGAGHNLRCVYWEDEWWLYQELKARGIAWQDSKTAAPEGTDAAGRMWSDENHRGR